MEAYVACLFLASYWLVFLFYYLFTKFFGSTSSNLVLIWLDQNPDSSTIDRLEKLCHRRILTMTTSEECVQYFNALKNSDRPICLITSGAFGITVIPLIHNIDQLDSVVVFCFDITKYDFMKKRYKKIRQIVNTYHDLALDLQINFRSKEKLTHSINIFDIEKLKGLRTLDSSSAVSHLKFTIFNENKQYPVHEISKADTFFLWLKLLTNVLQKVNHPRDTLNEMLTKCREYYQDNSEQLEIIDKFGRDYRKEDAIHWYTTDSFVSKLINKALRTEDFHALYICRAYIADLSEQLHREFDDYKQLLIEFEQPLAQWTVYHGRSMSEEEIDDLRDKKGQYIALNGFLSTSRKKSVADIYCKEVMFIIETTFDLSHGCFAHVAPMSRFPEEDEVLFDLASVFQIKEVQYNDNENRWDIYLSTTDEGTNVVQAYINSIKQEADEINIDFVFARLLIQMGNYQLADDYLTKLIATIPNEEDHRDLALVYYYRGLNFYREGNYTQAMNAYETALAMQQRLFPNGHSDLGETWGGIGLVYDNMGKYDLALKKHLECLAVSEKSLPKDHVHVAEALNNIGLCYDRLGNFELALEYDIRALEMKQSLFPYDHPDIATSLNNIGLAYYNHHEFDKALDYHRQALAMKERCLPPNHPEFAVSYCNLGLAHLALNHIDEAIQFYLKDLAMSEKTLSSDHAELGITHHNLGQVYRTKDPSSDLALKHFEKAIEIYMKTLPREHPYIGMSLMYTAEILCNQNKFSEALKIAQEAMQILTKTLPEEHQRRGESFFILAKIYHQLNDKEQALHHAHQAQMIQSKTLNVDQKDIQKTLSLIETLNLL
jgi:tetratricopeptide (TPR) repeat protein